MKNKIDFYRYLRSLLNEYKQNGLLSLADYWVKGVEETIGKAIEENFEKKLKTKLVCRDKKGNPILFISEENKDPLGRNYNYSGMKRIKW